MFELVIELLHPQMMTVANWDERLWLEPQELHKNNDLAIRFCISKIKLLLTFCNDSNGVACAQSFCIS